MRTLVKLVCVLVATAISFSGTWLRVRAPFCARLAWARVKGWAGRPRTRRGHVRVALSILSGKGLDARHERYRDPQGRLRHRFTCTDQNGDVHLIECDPSELPEAANLACYIGGFE